MQDTLTEDMFAYLKTSVSLCHEQDLDKMDLITRFLIVTIHGSLNVLVRQYACLQLLLFVCVCACACMCVCVFVCLFVFLCGYLS